MSSANSAFNTQGAINNNPSSVLNKFSLGTPSLNGSPMNNALDSMKIGSQSTPATTSGALTLSGSLNRNSLPVPQTAGVSNDSMSLQAPQTSGQPALKSHTITDAAGNTVTQTYHKPDTQTDTIATTGGLLGSAGTNTGTQSTSSNTGVTTTGLLGDTTGTTQTTPPATGVPGAIQDLQGIGQNGSQGYNQAVQNLSDFDRTLAQKYGAIESTPIPLEFQQGREQVIARQATSERAALQNAVNQQQTQQGQQTTALNDAGLLGTQTAPYGNYSFAQNGTVGNNGTGTAGVAPTDPFYKTLQTYAQLRATGQESLIPSSVSGNSVLNAQLTQMAQGINPQYNANTAAGTASAQQSNSQTAGTASVDANNKIYQDALANSANLQQQLGNVDQLGSLLLTTAQNGGINPSSSKFANQTIGQVRSQLSNAQQAQFDSTMQTLTAKIGLLLNVGGGAITDQVRSSANQVIDGTLALSALPAVLSQIQSEGAIVSKNQADVATKAYQNVTQTNNQLNGNTTTQSGSLSWDTI